MFKVVNDVLVFMGVFLITSLFFTVSTTVLGITLYSSKVGMFTQLAITIIATLVVMAGRETTCGKSSS